MPDAALDAAIEGGGSDGEAPSEDQIACDNFDPQERSQTVLSEDTVLTAQNPVTSHELKAAPQGERDGFDLETSTVILDLQANDATADIQLGIAQTMLLVGFDTGGVCAMGSGYNSISEVPFETHNCLWDGVDLGTSGSGASDPDATIGAIARNRAHDRYFKLRITSYAVNDSGGQPLGSVSFEVQEVVYTSSSTTIHRFVLGQNVTAYQPGLIFQSSDRTEAYTQSLTAADIALRLNGPLQLQAASPAGLCKQGEDFVHILDVPTTINGCDFVQTVPLAGDDEPYTDSKFDGWGFIARAQDGQTYYTVLVSDDQVGSFAGSPSACLSFEARPLE